MPGLTRHDAAGSVRKSFALHQERQMTPFVLNKRQELEVLIRCLQISKLNLQHSCVAETVGVNSHSYPLLQLELFSSCLAPTLTPDKYLKVTGFGKS